MWRWRGGAFEHEVVPIFNLHGGRFSADHRRRELELLDRRFGSRREPRMRTRIQDLDRAHRALFIDYDGERDRAGDPGRVGVGGIDRRDEVRQDGRLDRLLSAAIRRGGSGRRGRGGRRLGGGSGRVDPAVHRRRRDHLSL